jgi:hypothetical protein
MSAKSLGQIHTVNNFYPVSASGDLMNIDLPGQLTDQLQRMVRCGNYFKIVGIDMTLDTVGTNGGGQVTDSYVIMPRLRAGAKRLEVPSRVCVK